MHRKEKEKQKRTENKQRELETWAFTHGQRKNFEMIKTATSETSAIRPMPKNLTAESPVQDKGSIQDLQITVVGDN